MQILQNCYGNVVGKCVYKERLFLLEGQLYEERLVFNYFKSNTKGT